MNNQKLIVAGFIAFLGSFLATTQFVTAQAADGNVDRLSKLIDAITLVESSGRSDAKGDYRGGKPMAIGILQLWPIAVDDANRIAKLRKMGVRFSYDDRYSPAKSDQMFRIIAPHYTPSLNWELMARKWNRGQKKHRYMDSLGDAYWRRVQAKLK